MKEEEQKAKKKGFIGEFKEFAIRGNMVDMVVGIVIGVAFTAIVNSLVGDILMPIIGLLTDNYNFANLAITLSENNAITYGAFIEAILNFILIALVLFTIIKFFNNLRAEKEEEPPKPTELEVLEEIRDLLKK